MVGGWDRRISSWSLRHPYLFSSTARAARQSDDFLTASQLLMIGSAIAAGPNGGSQVGGRLERLLVHGVGMLATHGLTQGGKIAFRRLRPDESDRHSLPSGHASTAFFAGGTSIQNFSDIEMSRGLRLAANLLSGSLATATAWSRVEAGVHYPTDVFLGAALGNAMSIFFFELYKGDGDAPRVSIHPGRFGSTISVELRIN